MTKESIDQKKKLAEQFVETETRPEDPLRDMAEMIAHFLMEAEVTQKLGAESHKRSKERSGYRNGHRNRRWGTLLGTLSLRVPKLREGGYVPSFIEGPRRSEHALISVIQEAVVQGVSMRKIQNMLAEFEIAGVSADQTSRFCAALDEKVRQFRERPLDESRYVWVDRRSGETIASRVWQW